MSRLDPLRERQDYLDAIEAERERQLDYDRPHAERDANRSDSHEPARGPSTSIQTPRPEVRFEDSRGPVYDRDRGYRLRESEIRTLVDLGKFRVIAAADLADHAYGGQRDQTIYSGFVKPREANHDADLYKLYHQELTRILKQGGRNPRVILDFELK